MKCSKCGQSTVLDSETVHDYRTERKYKCKFKHEFTTMEVLLPAISKKDLLSSERGAAARAKTFERNQNILVGITCLKAADIGRIQGLTATRIRQIRNEVPLLIESSDAPVPTDKRKPQHRGERVYRMGRLTREGEK